MRDSRSLTRFLCALVCVLFMMCGTATAVTVPAAPTGPTTPTGGWAIEYADGFGDCLTDPNTLCSLGAARADNTLGAASHANGAGNANEIAGLVPSAVNVTSAGLDLHCASASVAPNPYGDPDTCGAVTGGAYGSVVPGAYHWTPTKSTHFVLEAQFQVPQNQGNMDPSFWSNGPSDVEEVDHPELWGMSHVPTVGVSNTWKGYLFGDPAVPFDSGGATGNVQLTFGTSPVPAIDPSLGLHTWTLDENGLVFTSYLDGVKLGTKTYSPFNSQSGVFKFLLMSSMRKDVKTGKDYALPSGGNDLIFRYVAVYEPASAANRSASLIVPGTNVQ
jgi:hypothetical protein